MALTLNKNLPHTGSSGNDLEMFITKAGNICVVPAIHFCLVSSGEGEMNAGRRMKITINTIKNFPLIPGKISEPGNKINNGNGKISQHEPVRMGVVTNGIANGRTLRAVLERQLWLDVLDLAKEYVGNPTEGMKFFDQSIIRKWKKSGKTNGSQLTVYTGEVKALAKLTIIEKEFAETQKFNIENSGETILHLYLAAAPEDEVPATAIILQPGDEGEYTALELGAI